MKKYLFLIISGLLYWLIEIGLVKFSRLAHLGDGFEIFFIIFLMPLVFGIIIISILNEQRFIGAAYLTISIMIYQLIFTSQVLFTTPKDLNSIEIISRIFFSKWIITIFLSFLGGLIAIYLKKRISEKTKKHSSAPLIIENEKDKK